MARFGRSKTGILGDDLGMQRALSDRLLPLLVAAMLFLAALALAGALAASGLAARWSSGPAAMITVTIPSDRRADTPPGSQASGTAPKAAAGVDAAAAVLSASPSIDTFRLLPETELNQLLKPWLGEDPSHLALRLPAMFEVRLKPGAQDPGLAARLAAAAPGTSVEHNGEWLSHLAALIRSLQACAALALLVVTFVAAAVVGVATRAGLASRRDSIDIVHGLGATDGLIAGQFANRVTVLVLAGALLGVLLALPVLLSLSQLAAPFRVSPTRIGGIWPQLPPLLWELLAAMPLAASIIGWGTAQITVRGWLRRLP